jgi:dienelactone hydrolase
VVFGPNPRGSSGRGEAFQKTTFGDWGNAGVVDVLAAADYLVATGIADESRLGVGGWSNGAILTNYVIASDTRFRAATSGGGMSNMFAGFGTDSWWQDWELELGLPWETPENWLRLSYPFLHADRIETPTLFLSGMEDYNVPAIHAEQMYTALRRLGVPTQLVVYPGQGSSKPCTPVRKHEHRITGALNPAVQALQAVVSMLTAFGAATCVADSIVLLSVTPQACRKSLRKNPSRIERLLPSSWFSINQTDSSTSLRIRRCACGCRQRRTSGSRSGLHRFPTTSCAHQS